VTLSPHFVQQENAGHQRGQFNGTGNGIVQKEIANEHGTARG
jgi:hypothetical protein